MPQDATKTQRREDSEVGQRSLRHLIIFSPVPIHEKSRLRNQEKQFESEKQAVEQQQRHVSAREVL